jgi:hypothetical protein
MKSEAQIKRRIEQLQTKIPRLEKIAYAPQVTPGPFETGRENYTMGKRLDAENNRRMNAFNELTKAQDELSFLETRLANFKAGEVHLNGQPRKDAPSRQKKEAANLTIADFLRAHIKAGDVVGFALNPRNTLTVKRVSAKSITDAKDNRWSYNDIFLLKDGKPIEDSELRTMFANWMKSKEAM